MMLKQPMTTEELFNKIHGILKEKGKLPDILDYGLGTYDPVPIKTCEFELKNRLAYGGSEGIYLDLWIEYFAEDKKCTSKIGTFKTLEESNEAMHSMAGLLADFILEEYAYINAHLDDFTWEGVNVYPLDDTGKRIGYGYSCADMEAALKKKEELLKKYPQVMVRDNATREEKIWKRQAEERLKILLLNAIALFTEAHSDRYNSKKEFLDCLYGELGTDEAELRELGVNF